jgi:putative transposase
VPLRSVPESPARKASTVGRMPRLTRSELPDGIYHVTTRGVERRKIFLDDDDHRFLLGLLDATTVPPHWTLHARCLMPNHFHLVVETTPVQLSAAMRRLNGRYAEGFNAKYDRAGHLFGGRFGVRVVESDAHLESACRYVILNPVRAGLCKTAADWPWSWSRYGLDA